MKKVRYILVAGIGILALAATGIALSPSFGGAFALGAGMEPSRLCADITFGTEKYSESGGFGGKKVPVTNIGEVSLDATNAYWGGSGTAVRLGSSKNAGSLTIAFSEPLLIEEIKVLCYLYDSSGTLSLETDKGRGGSLAVTSTSVPSIGDDSTDPGYVFSDLGGREGILTESITLEGQNSKKRICLCKIVIAHYGEGSADSSVPSSSGSSSDADSSSPGSSSNPSLPDDLPAYYADIDWTLRGVDLMDELSYLINPHERLTYAELWDAFYKTDADEDGKLIDIYSDYRWTRSEQQGSGGVSGEGERYNREHSVPKSWFGDREGHATYTDLHHLFPTDSYVNSRRSNNPLGEVGIATYTSGNGSRLGSSSYPGYSGTVFEPVDEYKGDLARVYFYFVTCYRDDAPNWRDGTDQNIDPSEELRLKPWAIDMFLEWVEMDPVSEKEIARNEAVYGIQGNRNPYVDNPSAISLVFDA